MLPVPSQSLLGLSPPLPLELVKAITHMLEADALCALAETGRGGKWLVDDERSSADLWRRWTERCLPRPPSPVPGAPQPLLALLAKSNPEGFAIPDLLASAAPPSRPAVATLRRLRARAVRDALAPLLAPDAAAAEGPHNYAGPRSQHQQPSSSSSAPCLVSQYFMTHDALAVLRALGEAADAVLARQLQQGKEEGEEGDAMMDVVGVGLGVRGGVPAPPLAPVALLLALHVLHRLVLSEGGAALDGWRRWALTRLAGGPFVGMAAVAYWTMGSHNPFGFRARDVLRTEKADIRQLALGILQRAAVDAGRRKGAGVGVGVVGIAIPCSEPPLPPPAAQQGKGEGDAGTRLLARVEALRGRMPVSTLDPPVVYVEAAEPYMGGEEGSGVGRLVVNAFGHFELSSSPPRR